MFSTVQGIYSRKFSLVMIAEITARMVDFTKGLFKTTQSLACTVCILEAHPVSCMSGRQIMVMVGCRSRLSDADQKESSQETPRSSNVLSESHFYSNSSFLFSCS